MTEEKRKLRGSGVRYTLPFLGRHAGLWLVVSIGAVLVASVSTYLLSRNGGPEGGDATLLALTIQTLLLIVALVGLAVFTTHRLAGPWIAVRRALRRVREGDLDTTLTIRTSDRHLKDVEREFNAMVEELKGRKVEGWKGGRVER